MKTSAKKQKKTKRQGILPLFSSEMLILSYSLRFFSDSLSSVNSYLCGRNQNLEYEDNRKKNDSCGVRLFCCVW